jgi:hypothetical protein
MDVADPFSLALGSCDHSKLRIRECRTLRGFSQRALDDAACGIHTHAVHLSVVLALVGLQSQSPSDRAISGNHAPLQIHEGCGTHIWESQTTIKKRS